MRKELDKALCAKYPAIFRDRHADMKTTAMCWGFECGDGWYDLIDALCDLIEDWNKYNETTPVVATQVKEKYGTLRFYHSGGDDFVNGAVEMAERMSARICEECGRPGTLNTDGWWKVRCPEHS